MIIREVRENEKEKFNKAVKHPLQSWEWGEFRQKTGVDVFRMAQFEGEEMINTYQITFHKVPKFNYTVGYIPKSVIPNNEILQALRDLAVKKNTIFYKLEVNECEPALNEVKGKLEEVKKFFSQNGLIPGKPLFTKYSFVLDLTKSDEELTSMMKSKTRYNVKLAEKKGVKIEEDNSEEAFQEYLRLTFEETTVRQGFYAHNREYHQKMWECLRPTGMAHLFKAIYEGKTLVTWIVFVFNKVLYYPYGASSRENREVMASNLMMWEVIKFGKKMGCKSFDMWGSLGPNPDPKDSWIGFHRFKEGYGPTLIKFPGTYDFVIDEPKYKLYCLADKLRWKALKWKAKLGI